MPGAPAYFFAATPMDAREVVRDDERFFGVLCGPPWWGIVCVDDDKLEFMNETWGCFGEVGHPDGICDLDGMNLVSMNLESISVC